MTAIGELSLRWFRGGAAASEELSRDAAPVPSCEVDLPLLVANWSPLLFRVAYGVVRSRAEAEDIVQDTFVRVLEHRRELPAVRDQRVWLVRIAWRLALDRRRRIRPEQMDDTVADTLLSPAAAADRSVLGVDEMRRVLAAMDALPAAEREALLLSAFDELTTAEMAEVLGRGEGAVRALLSRARARLRERLNSNGTRPGKERRWL